MTTTHTHTKTMPDGTQVDIFKLHEILKERECFTMPISDIKKPSKSRRSGFSKKRSYEADTSFSLIIDENRFLIDGRHRYFKLLERGEKNVKVVIANEADIRSVTL